MITLRSTDRPRIVRTAEIMGTVISVDARDEHVSDVEIGEFFERLRADDRRFSTYRDDSEVSRFNSREINLMQASNDLIEVLELAEKVRFQTEGCFDVWRSPQYSGLDPSGIVKGWAVERAAQILFEAGWRNFRINAGGDVMVCGEAAIAKPWRVGIRHPYDGASLAGVLDLSDLAVATSGTYERGAHLFDPRGGGAMGEFLSTTVVGPSLALADAYATAIFIWGRDGLRWLERLEDYDAFAVTATHHVTWTTGLNRFLVRD